MPHDDTLFLKFASPLCIILRITLDELAPAHYGKRLDRSRTINNSVIIINSVTLIASTIIKCGNSKSAIFGSFWDEYIKTHAMKYNVVFMPNRIFLLFSLV